MPGPKYVSEFEFPSSFGFTGSASDSPLTTVRSHQRRRFQRGGAVESEENRKAREAAEKLERERKASEAEKKKKSNPSSIIDILRGKTRREREAELGLRRGGVARKKSLGGHVRYAKGGDVAQDKKLIKRAMDEHIAAPPPRGHGVKSKKSK